MPQMAPISWLTLFFMFFLTFTIFNILNYYCINNKSFLKSIKNKNILSSLNWKW